MSSETATREPGIGPVPKSEEEISKRKEKTVGAKDILGAVDNAIAEHKAEMMEVQWEFVEVKALLLGLMEQFAKLPRPKRIWLRCVGRKGGPLIIQAESNPDKILKDVRIRNFLLGCIQAPLGSEEGVSVELEW